MLLDKRNIGKHIKQNLVLLLIVKITYWVGQKVHSVFP